MTPERIAQLRRMESDDDEHGCSSSHCDMRHLGPFVTEMLNEIERLQEFAHTLIDGFEAMANTARDWLIHD